MLPDVEGLAGLDIGCGEGHNTRLLAQRGARVSAIDISEVFIRHAKDTEKETPIGIDYQVASAVDLPFAEGTFDFAAAFMSLMDVPETERALEEAHRVLKPGGVLVMTTPNAAGLMQRVVGAKRKIFGKPWCPIDDVPWHLWGFTPQNFRLCMEKAGFDVIAVDSLEPSPLSTNMNSGATRWKRMAIRAAAEASKVLNMSDRMVAFARKGAPGHS